MTARDEAQRARKALAKLEEQVAWAREEGATMPDSFWAAFGAAYVSVRLAERAERLEQEQAR